MVNGVLADELQLAVGIAAVEAQLARRQGDAQMVGLVVHELALDYDFFVIRLAIVLRR